MPAPMANSARRSGRVEASSGPEAPAPGIFETIGAGWRTARDDQTGRMEEARQAAYAGILSALVDSGYDVNRYVNPWAARPFNYEQLWRDAEEARRRDPRGFEAIPKTQDELEYRWKSDFAARQQRDARIMSRGSTVAGFVGGMGASMIDPVNIGATVATGGSGSVLRMAAREALVNGIISAVQQPLVAVERKKQGRELTLGDAAMNVAMDTAFGAAFPVAAHGIGAGLGGAVRGTAGARARLGEVVAAGRDAMPESLRTRWDAQLLAKADPLDDPVLLADLTEAVVGAANLTDAERAAVAVARREGAVDNANPFHGTGGGTDLHVNLASEAWRAALDANPLAPRAAVRGPSGTGTARSSASISASAVPGDATSAGRFMRRVRGAESNGKDGARNPLSSATGRYQFTSGTWLAYYKRRFGADGLSDAAILAKRGDGALQDTLMGDLTNDNAAALRRAGHAPNEGNLYLAHFAGPEGARKVLDADPHAPLSSVLDPKAMKANPFLRGKDAAWLVEWAHGKMGSAAGARSVEVRGDMPEASALQAAVDAALDRTARLAAEDRAARAGPTALDRAMDDALAPVDRLDLPEPAAPLEPRAIDSDAPRAEVLAILPQLRAMVDDPKRPSLNRVTTLAEQLGVSEPDLRTALGEMVRERRITVNSKSGHFMRKPPALSGPEDVLEFVARMGGIRDDEGHALGLRGISAAERRELHPAIIRNVERKRSGGGKRDWQKMTRRNGPLLRHEGLSVDGVGELLHAHGYLTGPDGARPSEADVLDFLEQRIANGKPAYPLGEAADPSLDPRWQQDAEPQADQFADHEVVIAKEDAIDVLVNLGIDSKLLDEATLDDVARMMLGAPEGMKPDEAAWYAMNMLAESAQADALAHSRGIDYDYGDYEPAGLSDLHAGSEDIPADADFAGWEPVGGYEASGGGRGGVFPGDQEPPGQLLADLAPEARSPFLDPDNAAAKAQADSLAHDARGASRVNDDGQADFAAPTAKQRRTALERKSEGRQKATVAQKPPGSDGGLFDVWAQNTEFRLDDEGGETSVSALLNDIDAEEAELAEIRACL